MGCGRDGGGWKDRKVMEVGNILRKYTNDWMDG